MILSVFELQIAKKKCPDLLRELFRSCNIEEDINIIESGMEGHKISLSIDSYIAGLVGCEDTLEAFSKVLTASGVEYDFNTMTITQMARLIKENKSEIENNLK